MKFVEEEKENESQAKKPKNETQIIHLVFRNQNNEDITLSFDKSINNIESIKEKIYTKLDIPKKDNIIRLFFKGRPLNDSTDLSSLRTNIKNYINIYRTFR